MKLRSGYLVFNKGLKMNSTKESSEESATETLIRDLSRCQEGVSTESVSDNTSKENRPSENMFESFASQLNLLKEHINQKFDSINSHLSSKIDAKVEELKLDMVNNFVNFQKEVKLHIESKQKDITATLLELQLNKTVENPIAVSLGSDNTVISKNQNDQVVIDIEQSATMNQNSLNDISSSNIVQMDDTSHSVVPKVITPGIVTPLKAFSLPSITDSPDYLRAVSSGVCPTTGSNSLIVPCTVLPGNVLQNYPVLTVAPAHASITVCSPSIQSPVPKPLRTLKPKLTTEEFIGSDFDADSEDNVQPIRLYRTGGERFILPGNPRVRTRGGFRRGGITPTERAGNLKSSNTPPDKGDTNRGGRRGRKPKAFPVIRRQSERLKKGEYSDSPKKTNFQETIEDIEEFIWGKNSDKSTELTPEKVTGETSVQNPCESRKEAVAPANPSVVDSLVQIDNICNNMHSNDTSNKTNISQEEIKTESRNLGTTIKTEMTKVNVTVTESNTNDNQIKSSEKPKETPRNLPAPSKKGLSLSSPRKGSHIRALDFSTPNKKATPRKANTSPKLVSQVKLAQMRALRRTNLFKSPAKKPKQSWDADLRAFVAPDIPLSSVNMRKRIPLKRPGRTSKFLSPKKMMLLKKAKKKKNEKGQSNNKKDTSETKPEKNIDIFNSTTQDSPTKTTEELVKQIEKDVLEVISEENSMSENDNSSVDNAILDQSSVTDIADDLNEIEARTQSDTNNKASTEKSSVPSQIAGKMMNKTPAKLDFAGLIAANMMTPVTKILKEQSSLLDNVHFLTPGFLPTPDGIANKDGDIRKVGTPSPKNYPQKDFNKSASDSDQSPVGIKECPVRIEEALAAEEQVVKPIQKEVQEKAQTSKSKEKTPKKKTSLHVAQKNPPSEKKSKKKRSFEELIIDQCLKNVEKDLFGTSSKKTPKKNISNDKNVQKKKVVVSKKEKQAKNSKDKKSKTVDTPSLASKSNEKQNVGIKLPSFEEMMSRLNKMNKLSSSSSDSSDSEIEKIKTVEPRGNSVSNDSFPRLRVSEEESLCSISVHNRFKSQNQTGPLAKIIKTPENSLSTRKVPLVKEKPFEIKETLSKKEINKVETLVSPSRPSIKEQIKDFSYKCRSNSSLKEFSFDYFDEGKNDNRTVMASKTLCLFEFPFDKKKLSDKSDLMSSKNTFASPDNTSKDVREHSSLDKKKTDVNFKTPHIDKLDNQVRVESSKSFRPLNIDEIHKRSARLIRSKSREPRHSLKKSRVGLSSHRLRYCERSVTPMERRRSRERYGDSVHKKYKRERTEEYRRKGISRSHRDWRSRSSERRVHSSAYPRSETRKDRERSHSPEYRSAKDKRYLSPAETVLRNFEESEKKSKGKEIKDNPNKKYHISEKSSHSDILKNERRTGSEERRTNSSLSMNKKDGRNRAVIVSPLDPRIHLKHRETQEKPLAESTPYEKAHLKESYNVNSNRSHVRKSLHGDTSKALQEGWHSSHANPESRYISTGFKGNSQRILRLSEEMSFVDNENIRSQCSSSVVQKNSFQTSALSKKNIIEGPSSPSPLSPESPPRDPRLSRYAHPEKNNKHSKRKIEDLEEGEISDESTRSYKPKQPCYDSRRRKLSDIPEGNADSDLE